MWVFIVMKFELETAMRLVGITDLSQCHPGLINTRDIEYLVPEPLSDEEEGEGEGGEGERGEGKGEGEGEGQVKAKL